MSLILDYLGNLIDFRWLENPLINQFNPHSPIPNMLTTWKRLIEDINQGVVNIIIPEAYNLYEPRNPFQTIYQESHNAFGNRFYVASAGWGIIKSEFKIPDYNITFSDTDEENNYRNPNNDYINDFNHILSIEGDILFLGSKKYLNQFISLTRNLPNRKIVFQNSQEILLPALNQNGGPFVQLYFPYPNNYTWHYAAARLLIEIYDI